MPDIFRVGVQPLGFDFEFVALVAERGARIDVGADVEQCLEVAAVARLTAGEMKCDG